MAAAGCGGARPHVTMNDCRYPVSLTSWLVDADGRPVSSSSFERVGSVSVRSRGWNIGWTIIPLGDVDLSEEVNRQVEEAGGEAVVNFRVTSDTPAFPDVLPGYFFVHWVPIWPGSVWVEGEGEIVRRPGHSPPKREAAPALVPDTGSGR